MPVILLFPHEKENRLFEDLSIVRKSPDYNQDLSARARLSAGICCIVIWSHLIGRRHSSHSLKFIHPPSPLLSICPCFCSLKQSLSHLGREIEGTQQKVTKNRKNLFVVSGIITDIWIPCMGAANCSVKKGKLHLNFPSVILAFVPWITGGLFCSRSVGSLWALSDCIWWHWAERW